MTNYGGTISQGQVWQQAVPANAARTQATVQNTQFGGAGYDRTGIDDGPPLRVYPFGVPPNVGPTPGDGSIVLRRAGDSVTLTGAATQTAIYVAGPKPGAAFSATDF